MNLAVDPLADLPITPAIASLPKADLHIHQEEVARLARVVAQRAGLQPYDPRPWIKQMMADTSPGMGRITSVYSPDQAARFPWNSGG